MDLKLRLIVFLLLFAYLVDCKRSGGRTSSRGRSSSGTSYWNRKNNKSSDSVKPSAPKEPEITKQSSNVQQSAPQGKPIGWNVDNNAAKASNVNPSHSAPNPPPPGYPGGVHPPAYSNQGVHPPAYPGQGVPPPAYSNQGVHPPAYSNQGAHPPAYPGQGVYPPAYSQHNPNYGQPNAGYGQQNPSYGYNQGYGQHNPNYGYNPNQNYGHHPHGPPPYQGYPNQMGNQMGGYGGYPQQTGMMGSMFGNSGGYGGYGGYGGMKKSGGFFGKHAFRNVLGGLFVYYMVSGLISRPYKVYNYYNQPAEQRQEISLPANVLTLCNENATNICVPGTIAICTQDQKILCVSTMTSTVPCKDNKGEMCVNSTIPCLDANDPMCQNKSTSDNTTTVNLPCFTKMTLQTDQMAVPPNITLPASENNKFCVTAMAVPDPSLPAEEAKNATATEAPTDSAWNLPVSRYASGFNSTVLRRR